MATLQIRVDDTLKKQADTLFRDLGLNTSVALNMFLAQCVRNQALPFTPTRTEKNNSKEETAEELKYTKADGYYDFESIL